MKYQEFKEKQYTQLSDFLDNWINYMNPCNISTTKKGLIKCIGFPKGDKEGKLCCNGTKIKSPCFIFNKPCKHLSNKGCTVDSLSCKQFFCEKAWKHLAFTKSPEDLSNFALALQYVSQTIRLHFIPCRPRQSKLQNFTYANEIFK